MNEKTYKPSNKFSFPAFLLLILAVAVVGSLLSIPYLKINKINPIVYLSILIVVAFGFLLGLVANLLIKKFKIRNPMVVVLAVLIGGLMFTYFKWSLYDYWDGKEMVDTICDELDISKKELRKNLSLYNEILEEDGLHIPDPDRSFIDVLTSPTTLIKDVKSINAEGRWTYKSRSGNSEGTTVKGTFLLIVWIAEAGVLLFVPMAMALKRSKHPFIESEDEWANEYKAPFLFANFDIKGRKKMILDSPDQLMYLHFLLLHQVLIMLKEHYITHQTLMNATFHFLQWCITLKIRNLMKIMK